MKKVDYWIVVYEKINPFRFVYFCHTFPVNKYPRNSAARARTLQFGVLNNNYINLLLDVMLAILSAISLRIFTRCLYGRVKIRHNSQKYSGIQHNKMANKIYKPWLQNKIISLSDTKYLAQWMSFYLLLAVSRRSLSSKGVEVSRSSM